MPNSTDLQQRQIELLEALRKDVADLSRLLSSHGRVGEAVVRAVTNIATGLQVHAEEHLRWMKLSEERHDEIVAGQLVVSGRVNGKPNGATGIVPVVSEKGERKDVSASFAIGGSRVDLSEEHVKLATSTVLRWLLALAGMAASAGAAWLAGHVK